MISASTVTATKGVTLYGFSSVRSTCCSGMPLPPLRTGTHHMIRSFFAASSKRNVTSIKYTAVDPVTALERGRNGNKRASRSSVSNFRPIQNSWFYSTTTTTTNRASSTTESDAPPPSLLPPRDVMMYDVCIVGGGPAGLSAAIKIKQLCQQYSDQKQISVCVIDKGRYGVYRDIVCASK